MAKLHTENINMLANLFIESKRENAELRQQLAESQKLSEERRGMLKKTFPGDEFDSCVSCHADVSEHKPDCDYIRLVKEVE